MDKKWMLILKIGTLATKHTLGGLANQIGKVTLVYFNGLHLQENNFVRDVFS